MAVSLGCGVGKMAALEFASFSGLKTTRVQAQSSSSLPRVKNQLKCCAVLAETKKQHVTTKSDEIFKAAKVIYFYQLLAVSNPSRMPSNPDICTAEIIPAQGSNELTGPH